MVDVEFVVQYLVLGQSAAHRGLTRNAGNIALLAMAAELALLSPGVAKGPADAYRDYRKLQHQIRLQGARAARVDPLPQTERRAAVDRLWTEVFGEPWGASATTG